MGTRALEKVSGGSPADLRLSPEDGFTATVSVARALIRRGVRPTVAKLVVERLAAGRPVAVSVKHFDGAGLVEELAAARVSAKPRTRDPRCLAEAVTKARQGLKLTQDQFANILGLPVATLRNWEQARTRLDAPTRLLMSMVAFAPDLAIEAASAGFEEIEAPFGRAAERTPS